MSEDNKVTAEVVHKELDLIQGCITRMAQNSFMMKGWALGILTALAAIGGERITLWILCLISMLFLLMLWTLDAFFLKMEKCYRFKYEWVIEVRPKGIGDNLYDLNPYNTTTRKDGKKTPSVISVMFSKPCTLLLFYGTPFVITLILFVCSVWNSCPCKSLIP